MTELKDVLEKPSLSIQILQKATIIHDSLKKKEDDKDNPIETALSPIPPYIGKNEIRLIIIGQDPTIRNPNQRKKIKVTLNLDNESGSIRLYIDKICRLLDITIDNVYATNLFKYFYSWPPADTPDVLLRHLEPNLALLKEEISSFRDATIITLGEPVLKLLATDKQYEKVRFHWDYNAKTKITNGNFRFCPSDKNKLGQALFPFPHQPSLRKTFYLYTLTQYCSFVQSKKFDNIR